MLEVWLEAKNESRSISRSILGLRDPNGKLGSFNYYVTMAFHE